MDRRNPKTQSHLLIIRAYMHPATHPQAAPYRLNALTLRVLAAPAVKRVLVFRDRGPRSTVSRSRACDVPDRPPLAGSSLLRRETGAVVALLLQ